MKNSVSLRGQVAVPGDKSITHRAVMFGALAEGVTEIRTETLGRDNMATIRIMGQLGARVEGELPELLLHIAKEEGLHQFTKSPDELARLSVTGCGLRGLRAPESELDCGNSGTTARLLSGVLAGQDFSASLKGDASLTRRPFKRVSVPLSKMGARFSADFLPLTITGARAEGQVRGLHHRSEQASAQVKSAILLAGLYTNEEVQVRESHLSRDHTERMFEAMGVSLERGVDQEGLSYVLLPAGTPRKLHATSLEIPRDFSAAAFFLVAGSIFPDSELLLPGVGINATRLGALHVLRRMGASIELVNERTICGEPVADLRVCSKTLRGVEVTAEDVVLGIDEIPILALAASVAEGPTRISGAGELRVKESDRLSTTAQILQSAGVEVEEFADGMLIQGQGSAAGLKLPAANLPWKKSGDHRIAMTGAILDLLVAGGYELPDRAAVETSFPNFQQCFAAIMRKV